MIYSGICSVTFRNLFPEQVAELSAEAGLKGIEWGGDVHVPTSDLGHAEKVHRLTLEQGLRVASYGSYYRLVESEAEGQPFEWTLETAIALGAPIIRVWAGGKGSADADELYRREVVDESRRIADLAGEEGIGLSYEFHGGTLTDTNESALGLLRTVAHDNVHTYWQPPGDESIEYALEGLESVLPWLTHLHVHHFPTIDGERERCPLADGRALWQQYLQKAASLEGDRFALIEFVRDDATTQLVEDARTLNKWLAEVNG